MGYQIDENEPGRGISVSMGPVAGKKHNLWTEHRARLENTDNERTKFNITLIDRPIEEVYEELFSEAVKDYNEGQSRADRKISNYMEKIKGMKKEKVSHEVVFQIGNMVNNSAELEANRAESSKIYKELLEKFIRKYRQYEIVTAVIHNDEATPHMHVEFVPVGEGYAKGQQKRNSLSRANELMGFGHVKYACASMRELLIEVAKENGIEKVDLGIKRGRLNVDDFKHKFPVEELNSLDYPYNNDPICFAILQEFQELTQEASKELAEAEAKIQKWMGIAENPRDLKKKASDFISEFSTVTCRIAELRKEIDEKFQVFREYVLNLPVRLADHVSTIFDAEGKLDFLSLKKHPRWDAHMEIDETQFLERLEEDWDTSELGVAGELEALDRRNRGQSVTWDDMHSGKERHLHR